MLFIGLSECMDATHFVPAGMEAIYLVFPLQTVVCAGVLAYFWREYRLETPRRAWLAVGIGIVVFALWISPQVVFHWAARVKGFDPDIFAGRPRLYWGEVVLRFLRLVIVVPLLEEIFWRGFLLRYLVGERFDAIPFGTYSPMVNVLVAVGFMLEHSPQDWPAALAAGFLYNLVAYRTKSLSSCALAHGLTNALLGGFIMMTRQWGFW
jgi:CAAX prenyl protease-like protein